MLVAPHPDPYARLRVYDGHWEVLAKGSAPAVQVINHCAQAGQYFACDQSVDGKHAALLLFVPVKESPSGGQEYRNRAVTAAAGGDWGSLLIEGDHWIYSWSGTADGKANYGRVVNVFNGRDHIHFDVQSSTDGTTWKTDQSGDERRVK